MSAKSAANPISAAGSGVPPVISADTGPPPKANGTTTMPLSDTTKPIPKSTLNGVTSGKSQSALEIPNSKPLVPRANGSNEPWPTPHSVEEFAAQVNAVATAVLNGMVVGREAVEAVRVYSGLARTVVQAKATEVQISRMVGRKSNVSLAIRKEETEQ